MSRVTYVSGLQLRYRKSGYPQLSPTFFGQYQGCSGTGLLEVELVLDGTDPPVWRRLLAPVGASLEDLHDAIQSVTGWWDYHLHEFTIDGQRYGSPEYEEDAGGEEFGPRMQDDAGVFLGDLWAAGVRQFRYEYDFGDSWQWSVTLQGMTRSRGGPRRFRCTDGGRAAPPEDCGGIGGFEELCAVLADPNDPDHEEMKAWAPTGYDPGLFQPAGADWVLANRFEGADWEHETGWLGGLPGVLTITAPYYGALWCRLMHPDVRDARCAARVAEKLVKEFGRRPVPALGGMSRRELTDLLIPTSLWHKGDLIRYPREMEEVILKRIPIYRQARVMLSLLLEWGPQSVDAYGAPPEELERAYLEQLGRLDGGTGPGQSSVPFLIPEGEAGTVILCRFLKHAGSIRYYAKSYQVSKRAEQVLQDGSGADLFAALFSGWFGPRSQPQDGPYAERLLDRTLIYSLYRWVRLEPSWFAPADLMERVLLPYVHSHLIRSLGYVGAEQALIRDLLGPLTGFGMAEAGPVRDGGGAVRYRPTEFARRFLLFPALP